MKKPLQKEAEGRWCEQNPCTGIQTCSEDMGAAASYFQLQTQTSREVESLLPQWVHAKAWGPEGWKMVTNRSHLRLPVCWCCSRKSCTRQAKEPLSTQLPYPRYHVITWDQGLWTIKPVVCLEPVPRNKRGRDSERPAHRDEEGPPLAATGDKPSRRNEDPTQPEIK